MKTLFVTFGHGQPHFPGCLRCEIIADSNVEADRIIREQLAKHKIRWAFIYQSQSEMDVDDAVVKGLLTNEGLELHDV